MDVDSTQTTLVGRENGKADHNKNSITAPSRSDKDMLSERRGEINLSGRSNQAPVSSTRAPHCQSNGHSGSPARANDKRSPGGRADGRDGNRTPQVSENGSTRGQGRVSPESDPENRSSLSPCYEIPVSKQLASSAMGGIPDTLSSDIGESTSAGMDDWRDVFDVTGYGNPSKPEVNVPSGNGDDVDAHVPTVSFESPGDYSKAPEDGPDPYLYNGRFNGAADQNGPRGGPKLSEERAHLISPTDLISESSNERQDNTTTNNNNNHEFARDKTNDIDNRRTSQRFPGANGEVMTSLNQNGKLEWHEFDTPDRYQSSFPTPESHRITPNLTTATIPATTTPLPNGVHVEPSSKGQGYPTLTSPDFPKAVPSLDRNAPSTSPAVHQRNCAGEDEGDNGAVIVTGNDVDDRRQGSPVLAKGASPWPRPSGNNRNVTTGSNVSKIENIPRQPNKNTAKGLNLKESTMNPIAYSCPDENPRSVVGAPSHMNSLQLQATGECFSNVSAGGKGELRHTARRGHFDDRHAGHESTVLPFCQQHTSIETGKLGNGYTSFEEDQTAYLNRNDDNDDDVNCDVLSPPSGNKNSSGRPASERGQLKHTAQPSSRSLRSPVVDVNQRSPLPLSLLADERRATDRTDVNLEVSEDNVDASFKTPLLTNDDGDNKSDDGEEGGNVEDYSHFSQSDKRKSPHGKLTLEIEPLLSPGEFSKPQNKRNMSHPVTESYRKMPDTSNDDVISTGHNGVNGNAYSISGNGEDKTDHSYGRLDASSSSVDGGLPVSMNGSLFADVGKLTTQVSVDTRSDRGNNNDDEEEDDHGPCGWGPFQLGFCQRFRTPRWFLLVITLCGACQGMAINGFVNTVISTIEKRFEISSTESGLIASCYDIMFVLLVIPVSYFGGHGNKPRYLGWGILVLGLGSFVFSLPHFLSGTYDVDDAQDTMCRLNSTDVTSCTSQGSLSNYKYFFFLGQLLHGAGATPLYTLAVVYLDENLPIRSSSVYSAVFYTGAIVGPAVGYMLGAQLLNTYTDFDAGIDPDQMGLDVNNPKWVGAWWLGFLISGLMAVLLSLPLLAFPVALPGSQKYAKERGAEMQAQKSEDKTGQEKSIRDILLSIKLLLTNLPFMFINVAAAADAIAVSGFSTFMPKFIEYQFSISSARSALIVGLAVVPAGGGATFLGGFLVSKFNLKVKGILRLCTVSATVLLVLTLALLMRCDTGKFAGVTTQYQSTDHKIDFLGKQLVSDCNRDCGCREEDYYPMCGSDNVLYFSPCYAGCTTTVHEGSSKYYTNCSCLNYNYMLNADSLYQGEFGKCNGTCDWLTPFMILFGVMMVLMFITSMPSLTATLRCVPDHQRAFGLGIQWIVARCLGSIPGPILFGKMFDLACLLWQKRCHGSGSCFFYNNRDMQMNLLAVSIVFLFVAAFTFFLAMWFYKAKVPDESIHLEVKRKQESFRVSQNTILPETPTTASVNGINDPT